MKSVGTFIVALGLFEMFLVALGAPISHAAETRISIVVSGSQSQKFNNWPNAALAQAFIDYWKFFIDGNHEGAYAAEAPHFRFLYGEDRYSPYFFGATKSGIYEVQAMDPVLKGDFCAEIPIYVMKKLANGEITRFGMRDRWIQVQGRWYHLLRDPIAFPGV